MTADVSGLIGFLDASPTPRHAVLAATALLKDGDFVRYEPGASHGAVDRGFQSRDGALIAWKANTGAPAARGFRIVGAHTDSPGFRIKPNPVMHSGGATMLGVEVYGGPLVNSWLDRDLGLAGTVLVGTPQDSRTVVVRDDSAVLRIPQLAIHLDRESAEVGLKLDRQQQLRPMWSIETRSSEAFCAYVGGLAGVDAVDVLGWELSPFDLAGARVAGSNDELLVSARLDDLVGCHSALEALISSDPPEGIIALVVLCDHEEVGSMAANGAASAWVERTCEQLARSLGCDRTTFLSALDASSGVSVDMAHATHPNYPQRHDPVQLVRLDGGPVVKHNAQQRYATSLTSSARFLGACASAGVDVQHFVSHSDMPCGSTIGPLLGTGLGIPFVDVGIAQLAMHSVREVCGSSDPDRLIRSLDAFFSLR